MCGSWPHWMSYKRDSWDRQPCYIWKCLQIWKEEEKQSGYFPRSRQVRWMVGSWWVGCSALKRGHSASSDAQAARGSWTSVTYFTWWRGIILSPNLWHWCRPAQPEDWLIDWFLNFPPMVLRYNWYTLPYQFKVYSIMVWPTYIVKWYHNMFS